MTLRRRELPMKALVLAFVAGIVAGKAIAKECQPPTSDLRSVSLAGAKSVSVIYTDSFGLLFFFAVPAG